MHDSHPCNQDLSRASAVGGGADCSDADALTVAGVAVGADGGFAGGAAAGVVAVGAVGWVSGAAVGAGVAVGVAGWGAGGAGVAGGAGAAGAAVAASVAVVAGGFSFVAFSASAAGAGVFAAGIRFVASFANACSLRFSIASLLRLGRVFGSYFPECVPSTLQPSLNESCWYRWVYRWAPENKQVARISASLAQGRANSEPPSLELARPWPKNA